MTNIYMGEAISKGASNVATYNRERPERDARREEAQSRQELSALKLEDYKDTAQNRKSRQDLELEQTKQQLNQLQSTSAEKATYAAFDAYESTDDIKHLNNFLTDIKKTPQGARMYGGMTRLDKITDTPENRSQLSRAGITDLDGYFSDPDKHGNHVVATSPDGKQSVIDLDTIYKQTRYLTYADKTASERFKARRNISSLQKYGIAFGEMNNIERAARSISEETGEAYSTVLERLSKGKSGGSRLERVAANLMEDDPDLTYNEAISKAARLGSAGSAIEREYERVKEGDRTLSDDEARNQARKNIERRTTKARDVESARDVRVQMDEAAGGDFFEADLADPKMRRKMGPLVAELEQFSGKELSVKDRDRLHNIRKLMALGETAGAEITDEETGLLDNTLHNLKKYMSDSVVGIKGTAAYATFRNVLRHALYGSALSAAEIKSFNEAMGTLKQKKGPVLQELLTQMEDLKTELQGVYDMTDPHLAYYYSGKTKEEMSGIITQMERRIDFISGFKPKPKGQKVEFTGSPEEKQALLDKELPNGS